VRRPGQFARAAALAAALMGGGAAGGCRPELLDQPWLVTAPRLLGWTAQPPEAPPGGAVTLQAVALDPAGPADTAATTWTFCRAPKPLDEDRVVAPDCLTTAPADAAGDPVQVALPADACRLFGPDVPQPAPGAPPTRPRDPDATGGYYQPITFALGASVAVGLERVTCDLPDASLAAAGAFQAAYHANQNPTITGLSFTSGGAAIDPAAVPAGAPVDVQATWAAGSAESYVVYDRASLAVVGAVETLAAAWYVTGGALDRADAVIADPAVLAAAATWRAPAAAGTYEIVLLLRDSRGGAAVARAALTVAGARP
jgi:hypothetical protein